jgi:GNAT superfamily N-acetyltransferase
MSMAQPPETEILFEPDPGEVADEIEARLLASLRSNVPPNDSAPFALIARDGDGALLGGLVGSTSYGWLLIKVLWVAEHLRGQGLGARIMERAEREAVSRGCHGAWLDTSSVRARNFYTRLGYGEFGRLENGPGEEPRGHHRFFLCKRLGS